MEIISVMSRCPWPNDTYHFQVTEHYQNYWHQVQPRAIETGLQLTFSFDQTSWFSNLTLGWENYFWKEAVVNNFNWLSRESAVKAVCNHSWQFYREDDDDGLDIELKIAFSAVQLTKLITFLSGLSPGQFSSQTP